MLPLLAAIPTCVEIAVGAAAVVAGKKLSK
jgi:hypothetical protein